jgi:4-hydroxy-3-polyprenylbenzoate decarboxylase
MGAVIVDANPGFDNETKTIDDRVEFVVGKIFDQLNIKHQLQLRWGE